MIEPIFTMLLSCTGGRDRPFVYQGENVLIAACDECNFVQDYLPFVQWAGHSFICNPLLLVRALPERVDALLSRSGDKEENIDKNPTSIRIVSQDVVFLGRVYRAENIFSRERGLHLPTVLIPESKQQRSFESSIIGIEKSFPLPPCPSQLKEHSRHLCTCLCKDPDLELISVRVRMRCSEMGMQVQEPILNKISDALQHVLNGSRVAMPHKSTTSSKAAPKRKEGINPAHPVAIPRVIPAFESVASFDRSIKLCRCV